MAAQEELPGLGGWEQPELPIKDNLSDAEILDALDAFHTDINAVEQTGFGMESLDMTFHQHLGELAVERGLMSPAGDETLTALESNIVTIRKNLKNPSGLTAESKKELQDSLALYEAEYSEYIHKQNTKVSA